MYILGINCVYHESAVALIKVENDTWNLLSFVEEERFNRYKRAKPAKIDNCDVLPEMSLKWILEQNNLSLKDISHIGTSMNPEKRHSKNTNHKHPYSIKEGDFGTSEGETLFYNSVKNVETKLREMDFEGTFHFLNHHDCHSASSFYVSG